MNKNMIRLCTILELGCVAGLTAIALKRNNDCYKAECKAIDLELKLGLTEIECGLKGYENERLKKELEQLKSQNEEEAE